MQAASLSSQLLTWFDLYGRHTLPWQVDKTPYRVWVSEIMLQQTQVTTVIPYYARFMQRFPTVHDLAAAPLDDVLLHWAGLGYYSRARNLWKSANLIVNTWGGGFSTDFEDWVALPGIGPSTAAAICSICFNQPYAILDGNVKRVLTRVFSYAHPINTPKAETELKVLAQSLLPTERANAYTQAIMDLGALICTPKNPDCQFCPWQRECSAHKNHSVLEYPIKNKLPKKQMRQGTMIVFKHQNQVAVRQQPMKGLWAGLWSCPIIWKPSDRMISFVRRHLNANIHVVSEQKELRHTLTHLHLKITPVLFELENPFEIEASMPWRWYDLKGHTSLGFSVPMRKVLQELRHVL